MTNLCFYIHLEKVYKISHRKEILYVIAYNILVILNLPLAFSSAVLLPRVLQSSESPQKKGTTESVLKEKCFDNLLRFIVLRSSTFGSS